METKTYPLNAPKTLWKGYGATINGNQTKDEPLLDHVARRVLEHSDRDAIRDEHLEAARRQLGMEANS